MDELDKLNNLALYSVFAGAGFITKKLDYKSLGVYEVSEILYQLISSHNYFKLQKSLYHFLAQVYGDSFIYENDLIIAIDSVAAFVANMGFKF